MLSSLEKAIATATFYCRLPEGDGNMTGMFSEVDTTGRKTGTLVGVPCAMRGCHMYYGEGERGSGPVGNPS